MGAIKTTKWKAVRALINTWLKDESFYCNHCGLDAHPALLLKESCCENPQIGRNKDHYVGCVKQNKAISQQSKKSTGATDSGAMRHAIALPPRLMSFLENHFRDNYGEKLFNDKKELHQFMREFPVFCVCEKV